MVDLWFAKGLIFCCCEVEFSYFCDPCTAPKPGAYARRLARVVEEARLESVYTGNRIEGSNPSVSALAHRSFSVGGFFLCGLRRTQSARNFLPFIDVLIFLGILNFAIFAERKLNVDCLCFKV